MIGLGFCKAVFAQTELHTLIQSSTKNYPLWLARQYETESLQAQIQVQKKAIIPRVEASYQANIATFNNLTGLFYGQGLLPISGPPSDKNDFTPTTGSAVGLFGTWSPYTFGQIAAKIKVIEQEVLAHRLETEDQKLRHQLQIIQQYLETVQYRALLSLNKQNRQRLDKMQVLVNDLVQKGLKPSSDTILLAAERLRMQIEQNQYEGQVSRGNIKLAEWTGLSSVAVQDTSWLVQLPETTVIINSDVHPTEKIASATYHIEKAHLQVLEKNYKPKLTIWGGSFARGSGVDRSFFTGLGFQRINYGIGAHIGIPLFYKTEKETLLHQQSLRIKAATERINHVKLSLKRQAELAHSIYEEAITIATQIPVLVSETKKVLETSQDRYHRGLITLNEVIQNQYQLQKVESEQGMAGLQVWRALLIKAYTQGDLSLFLNSKK